MEKYFIVFLVMLGCQKRVDKKEEVLIYTPPTCAEHPLFCDDEEYDDLPESNDNDTGE